MLDISRDIHPLSSFKRNTTDFIAQMKQTGDPVVLTVNGKAALVVQDAAAYQKLLNLLAELEPKPSTEAELLEQINIGLSEEEWQQHHQLMAKRRAETLTEQEHNSLIRMSDRLELANVKRIQALGELSKHWNLSLEATMEKLGIESPDYD